MTVTDNYLRYTHVAFLSKKEDAFEMLQQAIALMENETGEKVLKFWSDNGGEYTSKRFKKYLRDRGIAQELTLPYTPQEDGVSERKNRTINRQDWTELGLKNSNGFEFVRKGQVNDWKNFFSKEQAKIFDRKITEKLRPELRKLYGPQEL